MTGTVVGFIPIVRTTFDTALAEQMIAQTRAALARLDAEVVGPESAVTSLDEMAAASADLAARKPDLLLVLQATFADTSMVTTLAQAVDAPIVLWAMPEPHTGGRLRLNSLCGVNLAAHALRRSGRGYHYLYAAPDDPAALDRLRKLLRAACARRKLGEARIGRVGEHPVGFETCACDPARIKARLGAEVVPVDLRRQVFEPARAAEPASVNAVETALRERVAGLDTVDQPALRGTLGAYLSLQATAEREQLDGLAVRCWPEFFTELGCAACGAMSMLSDEGTPCSCEADMNGTLTQLALQWLSGEPAFGADIVSIEAECDALVLWHCGLAPLSMADPDAVPQATIHSNRRLPLLMEFPLKPGPVTVARLSEATGDYRLVIGSGEMVRGPKAFSGTSGLLRMNRPASAVLDTILSEGLEHHISITYGDHADALEMLAQMLELPVLKL